jgi:thiol-disulfide isomerase/thioredoxin
VDRHTLKSTLEISTTIAVLLVAVAVLSILAVMVFLKPSVPTLSLGLERGKAFGQVSGVDYRSHKQTLLIALNTNCSYCQESVPLYRKLLEANPRGSESLHIIALFPNKAEEVAKYMKDNRLIVDSVPGVDFKSLRIAGTPTMILLSNNGEVKDFWTGKLTDRESDDFIRSFTAEK